MNADRLTELLAARAHEKAPRTPSCLDDHQLAGYVDGGLDEPARLHVERHLADCTHCLQLVGLLSDLRPVDSLERAEKQEVTTGGAPAPRRGWWRAPQWAAAAALLLAIPIVLQVTRSPDRAGVEPQRSGGPITRTATPRIVTLQLTTPSPGETVDPGALTFRWTAVPGTPFYDVRVVSDSGDVVVEQRVEGTAWQLPPRLELHRGAEYFVHVDAFPAGDKPVSSDHVAFTIAD